MPKLKLLNPTKQGLRWGKFLEEQSPMSDEMRMVFELMQNMEMEPPLVRYRIRHPDGRAHTKGEKWRPTDKVGAGKLYKNRGSARSLAKRMRFGRVYLHGQEYTDARIHGRKTWRDVEIEDARDLWVEAVVTIGLGEVE